MQDKNANVKVIRSVWRRTKKGYVKVRDLEPGKEVKGGGITGATTKFSPIAEATQLSASESPRDRLLHQVRAARNDIIRKLFEMAAERDRKQAIKGIARAQKNFLRWIKRG